MKIKLNVLRLFITIKILTTCTMCTAQNVSKDFSDLDLMIGNWRMETSKGVLYENWQKINDSTLKSRSYKVKEKDTLLLEEVEIVKRDNSIMYMPTVHGQNNERPVTFTLVKLENRTYTFENKIHDFPQRIIYGLPENNTMHAHIEGEVNGQFKRIDYTYKKGF